MTNRRAAPGPDGPVSKPDEAADAPKTLAEKVDFLFRTVLSPKGAEYSYQQVASAIEEAGGPTISSSYLWLLRKGDRDNPTMKHLEALALFFGVPADYFFDEQTATNVHDQLADLALLRDHGVRKVALRASGLSPESIDAITAMVEHLRRAEGLPVETDLPGTDER